MDKLQEPVISRFKLILPFLLESNLCAPKFAVKFLAVYLRIRGVPSRARAETQQNNHWDISSVLSVPPSRC
jgi:hypothetical protein